VGVHALTLPCKLQELISHAPVVVHIIDNQQCQLLLLLLLLLLQ